MDSVASSTAPSRRKFYLNVARCCACFLVVFSHVFAPIATSYSNYPSSTWWVFNLFNSLIRPAAALYVMISGVIFLGASREDSYAGFIWKRYSRLLPPFFVWSMIYAIYNAQKFDNSLAWDSLIGQFIQGPTDYHLWFMYMILGLYLVMPMLRRFVQSATDRDLWTLIGVWFGFLIVQFLVPGYDGSGPATILLSYGGYAVLGYALDRFDFSRVRPAAWVMLWGGILGLNALLTYGLTVNNNGIIDETFYFGTAPLIALQGMAMFILLKRCDEQSLLFQFHALRSTINRFSQHGYNIYLSHVLLIWLLIKGDLGFVISENTGGSLWIGVPLTTLLVLAGSLGISMLFQRLPLFSRLLVISAPKGGDNLTARGWQRQPSYNS